MEGKRIVVDKYMLEDLIEFQRIAFKPIRGYYYNEGRNEKLASTMKYLYQTRKEKKKEKNPIQAVYKLLMNAAYGKTLLKPFETHDVYIKSQPDENGICMKLEKHLAKNYHHIQDMKELPNGWWKLREFLTIQNHFNDCHCGVEILSMSKRVMNEVMCLAEDLKINMYYQDTDSIHMDDNCIPHLSVEYYKKYQKLLVGDNLGQFSSDLESDIINPSGRDEVDIKAVESVYLGKKAYIEVMLGANGVRDYHCRMKGVNNDGLKDKAFKDYRQDHEQPLLAMYLDLYDGKGVRFDLCCEGQKTAFDFRGNMSVHSKTVFERYVKFH